MTCLEHLVENGLAAVKENNHDGWMKIMREDHNLLHTNITLEDLWTICQYVEYVKCMYCESHNEWQPVSTGMFDKEEDFEDCTVRIYTNTVTGEQSIGWWENNDSPTVIAAESSFK